MGMRGQGGSRAHDTLGPSLDFAHGTLLLSVPYREYLNPFACRLEIGLFLSVLNIFVVVGLNNRLVGLIQCITLNLCEFKLLHGK